MDADESQGYAELPTRGGAAGPSGPAPAPEPEPEENDYSKDESYRIDDEGTEWWEDDAGTWWYRQQGEADWAQWED